ncbi:MAG: tetratricopeptide repeat protein [Candidatus Gastranaerophilaceae bacterium]
MIKKFLCSFITILSLTLFVQALCFAKEEQSKVKTNEDFGNYAINLLDPTMKVNELSVNFNITLSQMEAFNDFLSATDKFKQSNVEVAYEEYKNVLDKVETNDFGYTLMANKLAEYGFFYLSEFATKKMSDKDITSNHVENLKKFFYPNKRLTYKEEIYLAEAYANIMYNDQAKESLDDIIKQSDLLKNYDYANYIAALAAYKSNNLQVARQYINSAVSKNPQNLNYQILQAQIYADGAKPQTALKIVSHIKKEPLTESELQRRVNSIEQYVLYKSAEKDWLKNYHLGYYYFYQSEYSKSIRALQNALGKNKGNNAKVNSLMSKVYLAMNEYEKAQDSAQKAIKKNKNLADARMTRGKLNFIKKDYKNALKDFEKAEKDKSVSSDAQVKIAEIYQKQGEEKLAKAMFEKALKTSSTSVEAYYNIAMTEPFKQLNYLKKALGINITYTDAWLGLARYEINRDNFSLAQDYLSTVYYLNQNDYRYYYYQGLIYKSHDDIQTAALYFQKCLKLNPNCQEAKKELNL